jgi:hypothetical protein
LGEEATRLYYPNPAHGVSAITFELSEEMPVRLELYDALGRMVILLAERTFSGGVHTVFVNAAELPSGVYFYRFTGGEEVHVRKMMIFR